MCRSGLRRGPRLGQAAVGGLGRFGPVLGHCQGKPRSLTPSGAGSAECGARCVGSFGMTGANKTGVHVGEVGGSRERTRADWVGPVCGSGRQPWPAVAVVSAGPIGNRAGPSPAGASARQQQTACATPPGVVHGEDTAVVAGHSPTCVAYGEDTAVVAGHEPTCFAYGEDTAVVTGHSPTCVAYGEDTAVVTGHEPTCVAYGEDTAVVAGHSPTCVAYGEDAAVVTGHEPTCFAEDARSVRAPEKLAARGLQRGSPIWTTCTPAESPARIRGANWLGWKHEAATRAE
jgi:hypothetical protein